MLILAQFDSPGVIGGAFRGAIIGGAIGAAVGFVFWLVKKLQ